MKVVHKYATGVKIPKGAVYLSTQVETITKQGEENSLPVKITRNFLVWHYFLVEVKK